MPYILEATSSLRKYYKLLVMIPTGAQSDYCHRTTSYDSVLLFSIDKAMLHIPALQTKASLDLNE